MKVYTQIALYDNDERHFDGVCVYTDNVTFGLGYYDQTFDVDFEVNKGDIVYVVTVITREYDTFGDNGFNAKVVAVFDDIVQAHELAQKLDNKTFNNKEYTDKVEFYGKTYDAPWLHWGTALEEVRADAVIVGMGRIY